MTLWDETKDVIIVGSGGAGLLCGIMAGGMKKREMRGRRRDGREGGGMGERERGKYLKILIDNKLSSVILEKEPCWGGTTAYSGFLPFTLPSFLFLPPSSHPLISQFPFEFL